MKPKTPTNRIAILETLFLLLLFVSIAADRSPVALARASYSACSRAVDLILAGVFS